MSNVQEYHPVASARLLGDKEPADVAAKKLVASAATSQPATSTPECRVPRVTSDRDSRDVPSCAATPGDKPFQASVIADKYYLLDQVEGSSLYRCVDIKTRDELVCKVRNTSIYRVSTDSCPNMGSFVISGDRK